MVKDIRAGSIYSRPRYLTVFNGAVYFQADDGIHFRELWKSDGTAAGTVLVKDINPATVSGFSEVTDLTPIGDTLYFAANDGTHGMELWKTDEHDSQHRHGQGRPAGNRPHGDNITSGTDAVAFLTELNGDLLFTADDGSHGGELLAARRDRRGHVHGQGHLSRQ